MATDPDLQHTPTLSLQNNKQRAKASERKLVDNQGQEGPQRGSGGQREGASKGPEKHAKQLSGRSTDFELVEGRETDILGVLKGKVRKEKKAKENVKKKEQQIGKGGSGGVRSDMRKSDLSIPSARAIRQTTEDGRTSFHFSHDSVTKTSVISANDAGLVNRPGAAKDHGSYIERESAVALDANGEKIVPEIAPEIGGANEALNDNDQSVVGKILPPTPLIHAEESTHVISRPSRSLLQRVARLAFGIHESGPIRNAPGLDAIPALTSMRLLPGITMVRDDAEASVFLQGNEVHELGSGNVTGTDLRRPGGSDRGDGGRGNVTQISATVSPAADQGSYIERQEAMARQPDGTRVLFTNIDDDPEKRSEFWRLVEKSERDAGPDKMSFTVEDAPNFWSIVKSQNDCPDVLSAAIQNAAPHLPVTIESGGNVAMRAYLARQPGWIEVGQKITDESNDDYNIRRASALTKFTDGRGGRVQYRIIGELPHELSVSDQSAILREFSKEFEDRKLPYVAVMHAPDHTNNDKNWHFHLVYYDRPATRLTAEALVNRIPDTNLKNITLDRIGIGDVGRWDFDISEKYKTSSREVRERFPFAQDKDLSVSQDKLWISKLRAKLAEITNNHLEKAAIDRRLDPRRHEEMGIHSDPQEHLGTRLANLEAMGIATPTGVTNEERQWNSVLQRLDKDLERHKRDTERSAKKWLLQIDKATLSVETKKELLGSVTRWHQHKTECQEHGAIAERITEHKDRTLSRALKVKETCERHLAAINDGKATKFQSSRKGALEAKVDDAREHLAWAVGFLADEEKLIADCTASARRDQIIADSIAKLIESGLQPLHGREIADVGKPKQAPPPVLAADNDEKEASEKIYAGNRSLIKSQMDSFIAGIIRDKRRLVRAGRQIQPAVLTHDDDSIVGATNYPAMAQLLRPIMAEQTAEIVAIVKLITEDPMTVSERVNRGVVTLALKTVRKEMANAFLAYREDPEIVKACNMAFHVRPTADVREAEQRAKTFAETHAREAREASERAATAKPRIAPPAPSRDDLPLPKVAIPKAPAPLVADPADRVPLPAVRDRQSEGEKAKKPSQPNRHAINERIAMIVYEGGHRVRVDNGIARIADASMKAIGASAADIADPALQKRLVGMSETQSREIKRLTSYAREHPGQIIVIDGQQLLSQKSPRELVLMAQRYRQNELLGFVLEVMRTDYKKKLEQPEPLKAKMPDVVPHTLPEVPQSSEVPDHRSSHTQQRGQTGKQSEGDNEPSKVSELVPDYALRAEAKAYAEEQARIAAANEAAEAMPRPRFGRAIPGGVSPSLIAEASARRGKTMGVHRLIDAWMNSIEDGLDAEARGAIASQITSDREAVSELKNIDRVLARRIREDSDLVKKDRQPGLGLDFGLGNAPKI